MDPAAFHPIRQWIRERDRQRAEQERLAQLAHQAMLKRLALENNGKPMLRVVK